MFQRALLSVLALSAMTGWAVAQTTPPASTSATTTPATAAPNAGTASGLQTAQAGVVALRFVTVKPSDTVSSRLVGTDIYNKQNESVGEIEDLVIENGKTITGVVIGVGGFLGIGERYVAVDPANILLTPTNDGEFRGVLDTSKADLSNAPTFDYKRRR